VKGERKVLKANHEIRITNKLAVGAFKGNLKKGFHIFVVGELDYENGKAIVRVTDYGHEASYQYVGGGNETEDKPKQTAAAEPGRQAAPSAPAKQEPKRNPMSAMSGMNKSKKPEPGDDDGYFNTDKVYQDRGPSAQPEGFSDDDIPF
jgi:hypothetical protein